MKIRQVTTILARYPLTQPTGPSIWLYTHREVLLVRLETDDGLVGWGETCVMPGVRAVIDEVCAPLVLGQDPRQHRRLWQAMWQATLNGFAVGAMDIALHDLWGQACGLSIAELYGGRLRDHVPVYVSALSYVAGRDPADIWLDEAQRLVEQGIPAIKMRIGRYPWRHELPLIARVRDALPDAVRLMADGNAAYTLPTATRVGRALEQIGLDWFEEPMPQLSPSQADYAGYERLAAHLDIPIACGEILQSRGAFQQLLAQGKADIVQPDVAICGGIAETLFVADLARLAAVPCIPHCWGGAIAIAATLQLLALLPAPTAGPNAEVAPLELDVTENPLRTALLAEPLGVVAGRLAVPSGPGLGITVDEAALARYRVG